MTPQTTSLAYRVNESADFNPALRGETVAKAERREREGWPWPVSGDDTARATTTSWPLIGGAE